jgi:RimJ/RimL family protein N-acetyltransferase
MKIMDLFPVKMGNTYGAMMIVKLATATELQKLWEHENRHEQESGRDGDIIFMPFEKSKETPFADYQKEKTAQWSKPVTEVGWGRAWVALDQNQTVVGALKLYPMGKIETLLHRAILATGIERRTRGQGLGSHLMSAALTWAKQQPTLDWIELYVFGHNEAAQALYRKFGFEVIGTTPDMFRVHGQKIDDTKMVLRLR